MAANMVDFTDDNFQEEVLNSSQPVLVDFWAPWCGPCRMLAPTVEELAGEYEGSVKFGKLNTDDNTDVAATYGISSIPRVLVFNGGEVIEQFVGLTSKDELKQALDRVSA